MSKHSKYSSEIPDPGLRLSFLLLFELLNLSQRIIGLILLDKIAERRDIRNLDSFYTP